MTILQLLLLWLQYVSRLANLVQVARTSKHTTKIMIGCHDTTIIRHSGKLAVVIDCHTNNNFTISIKKDANINYHVMFVNPTLAQSTDGDKAACR